MQTKAILFLGKELIVVEFYPVLQIDISFLRHGSISHVVIVRTLFRNGGLNNEIDADCTYRTFRWFWINILRGAQYYIHTDTGPLSTQLCVNTEVKNMVRVL